MLEHVIVVQICQRIISSVDIRIVISKVGLKDERRRISGFGRGRMVAASIAAFGLDVLDIAVLEATLVIVPRRIA
jgi:hypothetical protein